MNSYWPGTQVKVSAVFQVAGVDTDPTATTLYYLTSTGGLTTVTTAAGGLTQDSTGHYHYDVVPGTSQVGTWYYRYVGTGAAAVSAEGAFAVRDTRFG